jgi:hypothetical protein
MKEVSKYLKYKKFAFICGTEKDMENIQDYLFSCGYGWETEFNKYIETLWTPPLVIKNYRYSDKFGSKYLIIDTVKSFNEEYKNKKFNGDVYNTRSFLLRKKIKRIKNKI